MKTLFCKYILVFSFIIIGVAQEKYDVLYLKNGNILKGVIVENVYGEYIRIELIGGSLMTVKYSIIDNMVKASATKESIEPPHNFNSPEMQSTDDNKLNQSKIINQFPQFQKGVYSISGGISYSKSNSETDISSSKSTEFSVSPGYSTFIANGLSLGIGILYNYSTYEYNSKYYYAFSYYNSTSKDTYYGADLSIKYYLFEMKNPLFFGGSLGYMRYDPNAEYFNYSIIVGLSFPVSLSIGIEPYFQYRTESGSGDYATGFSTGFRVAYYIFE